MRLGEAIRHNFSGAADVVGIASLGDAYWQAHADGAVENLAGAGALGGADGQPLKAPVVAISRAQGLIASVAADPLGRGYWLVSVEGRVLPFGDGLPDFGSPEPVYGIAPMAGKGYRLVDAAGTTHPFPA